VDEQLINSGWKALPEDGMSTTITAYAVRINTQFVIITKSLTYILLVVSIDGSDFVLDLPSKLTTRWTRWTANHLSKSTQPSESLICQYVQ